MKKLKTQPKKPSSPKSTPFFHQKAKPFFSDVQAKLTVGKTDDPEEREADQVADRVMQKQQTEVLHRQPMEEEEEMMQPKLQRQEEEEEAMQMKPERPEEEEEAAQPKLQAKESQGSSTVGPGFSKALRASKSAGQPLPKGTTAFMSGAMGADFRNVRIHTDTNAVNLNKAIHARAFTHGKDIYFNQGQFDPNTQKGQWLLAHELTHTIQQKAVRPKKIQRQEFEDHQVTGAATGYASDAINGLGRATNSARSHLNAYGHAVQNAIGSFERYARRRISAIGETMPGAGFMNSVFSIALAAVPIPGAGALLRVVGQAIRDAVISEVRSKLTQAAQSVTAGTDTDTLEQAVDSISQSTSDIATQVRDSAMRSFQGQIDPIIVALNNGDQLRSAQSEIVGMFYAAPSANVDDYLNRFFGIPMASSLTNVQVKVYENLIAAFEERVFLETATMRQSIEWATRATGRNTGAQEYGRHRARREAAQRRRQLEAAR